MLNVDLHQLSEPPDRLLALFTEAHASDKWAEGKARLFGWLGGLGLLFGFVGAIFGAAAGAVGVVAGLLVLVGGIVSLVIRSRYKRYDLDDRKVATVTQLLQLVAGGLPGRPISVHIDHRSYDKGDAAGSGGRRRHAQLKKYEHTWLTGALAPRRERTRSSVTDQVRRKEKPKRKYTKVTEHTVAALGHRPARDALRGRGRRRRAPAGAASGSVSSCGSRRPRAGRQGHVRDASGRLVYEPRRAQTSGVEALGSGDDTAAGAALDLRRSGPWRAARAA